MLLRRITQHVTDQNWFAVAIDFAIVVGGVFIGIQVANWNDARLEQTTEIAALEELLAEAELNVGMIREDFDHSEQTIRDRDALVAKLTAGDLENVTEAEVGHLIGDSRQYPGIPAVSSVYDGFVGSGVVGSLSDRDAAQSVARFHALVEGLSGATENFQFFVVEEYPHFSEYPGVRAVYDATQPDRRRYQIDLGTFIASERTMEDLVSLNRNQISFHGLRSAQLNAAETMCAELARALDRECNPRQFRRGENGQLISVE